jgi:glycosyltransferase involved in cell wall biosynthesis
VLVVAPQPFYEDRGTPIAVRDVLQALSDLSYAVDIVTYPVGRSIDIPRVTYFRAANPLRLRRVPIGLSLAKVVLDVSLVIALRRRLSTGRYACIHAVEEAAFPAVMLGRRFGIPVIYDMQSSLPEQLGQLLPFRSRPVQAGLRRLERWLLTHADYVVSSAGLAARVRSVAPGVRAREWRYSPSLHAPALEEVEGLRQALGIPAGSRVVVYTGTFAPYQGVRDLLAAMPLVRERVPAAVCVLVGADDATRQSLARPGDPNAEAAVRVVARQPREKIAAFLALADVLVSPRLHGGNLPLKVLDYLATGKPIVATDIAAHRAVLDDERALLVPPGTEHLARGIAELLDDPSLAARLAANARAYVNGSSGWFAFVESVAELYAEVVAGAPALAA